MKKKEQESQLLIYKDKKGNIEFRVDVSKETIWATQAQIAELFKTERSVITKHINKILKDKEIEEKSNVQKMHIAKSDKPVNFYSIDVILAIGYKTNSKTAIEFRKWATKTLRSYITDGFAINRKTISSHYEQFLKVVEDIKNLVPIPNALDVNDIVEIISLFADTWLSLDAYDKSELPKGKFTKKKVQLTTTKINAGLTQLKNELLQKSQATDIFGIEQREGSLAGIIGNVMQTFGGREVYSGVEEKAAHLLYFIVKNHPFIDGNKRSGAFVFVWFLKQANILDVSKITPSALTALTILVASSDPKDKDKDKDKIVGLVLNLILKK